jgi:hypothetical protein
MIANLRDLEKNITAADKPTSTDTRGTLIRVTGETTADARDQPEIDQ